MFGSKKKWLDKQLEQRKRSFTVGEVVACFNTDVTETIKKGRRYCRADCKVSKKTGVGGIQTTGRGSTIYKRRDTHSHPLQEARIGVVKGELVEVVLGTEDFPYDGFDFICEQIPHPLKVRGKVKGFEI